jgi:hypothetical protein
MNPTTLNTASVFAIDPGFGETKICIGGQTARQPSVLARPNNIGMAGIGMKTASQAHTIQIGWENFATGEGAWNWGNVLNNLDYSALSAPERRALIFSTAGLILAPGEYTFDLAVFGLPVPLMMDEVQGQTILNGLKAYKGRHTFSTQCGTYAITFNKLKALAQPVGAYADRLLDNELRIRKNGRQEEVAVLDVGMNTTDLYVLQDGKVLPRFVGGSKVGVRRLIELLEANGHDPEELDALLRSGRLKPSKEQLDSWLSEILAVIERTWSNLRRFNAIIPAGGGSVLLGEALRVALITKGAAVSIPEDPSLTNVRGLWKWAAYGR